MMTCKKCNYNFDMATNLDDGNKIFKDGDISICLNCGYVGQFKGNDAIPIDIRDIDDDTYNEINKIKKAWLIVKSKGDTTNG